VFWPYLLHICKGTAFVDGEQVKTGKYVSLLLLSCLILAMTAMASAEDSFPATAAADTITIERQVLYSRDFRIPKSFLPYRIGLALSGGGARGISQIGVLKAFDEAGLDISCIAGTSMGSIIGGLYASGYSAEEIEDLVGKVNFPELFSDSPRRRSLLIAQREEQDRYLFSIRFDGLKPYIPRALTVGQRLTAFLTDLTIRADYNCEGDFDRFPIPFRAIATDIGNGQEVVVKSGSLADAMRASMAFPLAFTPIELDGRSLMDGGMVDPIPVDVCRKMGADYVIAINTASPLMPVDKIDNPVDIANQVTTIMTQAAMAEQLSRADYIVTPIMGGLESFDFQMHDTLVACGYHTGKRAAETVLSNLPRDVTETQFFVKAIDINGKDPLLRQLRDNFPIHPGQKCTRDAIRQALIYADRAMKFNRLTATVESDENEVTIHLSGRPNVSARKITYEFKGNTVYPDSVMARLFPADDAPLSLVDVKSAADSIISFLHGDGYDLAHIRSIAYDHRAARVTVTFDEGILDFVDIRGNKRTRSWIIKANYPMRPGEPFNVRKSETGLANIYGTGFFEFVGLDLRPTENGVHLTINVREKKFTQIRIGAHWDDEYQSEMFAELLDDNVLGAGIQNLAHVHIGSRRNQYSLSLKTNRFSRTLITAQTGFYFSRLKRRLFQSDGAPLGYRVEDRLGWSILVGQQIARLGTIDIEYRLEDINTRLTLTDFQADHVLSAFTIKSTVETFNKFPYPDYGHRQDISVEFTGKWLGGTFEEYTKITGAVEGFAPIGNYLNFHPRVAAGISTANLPEVEKFFIGGMYSFSGYRTDQLAGDKFFVTNLQLRIKLPYRVYLLGNFDYGNVFDDYEHIKIKEFRSGWGGGISIDTPFGPFDFGAGKADETDWRLYLNIGLRF